jgi:hypothetical protein
MRNLIQVASCGLLLLTFQPTRAAVVAPVETLRSVAALPAHLVNQFTDAAAIVTTRAGDHLVLDRRAHTVFSIPASGSAARPLLQVGYEPGHLLQPGAMALSDDDLFAVLDAPNGVPRVQYFDTNGLRIGGFFLPVSSLSGRLTVDDGAIRSLSSLQFMGQTFLVSEPTWGSVITALDSKGTVIRQIGNLRPTGRESDPPVHLALNSGIPLIDPTGAFYFVFQTGVPMFRKYSSQGVLLFERHIEGVEIDAQVQTLPTVWPKRDEDEKPVAVSLIRTAAVDRAGRLWVSLQEPYTYVYDKTGEKIRVLQFHGASIVAPTHLFFDRHDRVMVTPGGYEFDTREGAAEMATPSRGPVSASSPTRR